MGSAGGNVNPWVKVISAIDITQVFKTKGDIRRWSAKRTIGGAVVLEALWQIHEFGLSWQGIVLAGVGVTPLCLSFFEKE
jgi:hypothetical protein